MYLYYFYKKTMVSLNIFKELFENLYRKMISNNSFVQSHSNLQLMKGPTSKKDLLMQSLTKYFQDETKLNRLKPIISGKSKISLRLLDWLVTNYSKKFGTSYRVKSTGKYFIIYPNYKAQLKAYSKDDFDPFCRNERISFYDHNDEEIETTVAQLNFFKWAIEGEVLDYAEENLEDIEKDMTDSLKNIYKKKNKGEKRRKRTALSISASRTVRKYDVSIVVKFD